MDIITNLGENHYVECGKGAITARRCMKQRYNELGFTKTVSSGRAVCINNLVTVGPSKPVLTARVIEHARKRKRQKKTSRQRRISKRDTQMTAMGTIVGGLRADSGELEEGAEAEEKAEAETTEKDKLGKLIALYKWRLAQSICQMQREEVELSGGVCLNSWKNTSCMELHYRNSEYQTRPHSWQASICTRDLHC